MKNNPRKFRLFVETVRGPWFSIGAHFDFQAPKIDIHFWWWIVSIGWLYMSDAAEQRNAPVQSEQKCPVCKIGNLENVLQCDYCFRVFDETEISTHSDGG